MSKAAIKVGSSYATPCTGAAAKVLELSRRAEGQGPYSVVFELARDTTASGTYPLVLVSYGVACAKYPNFAAARASGSGLAAGVAARAAHPGRSPGATRSG